MIPEQHFYDPDTHAFRDRPNRLAKILAVVFVFPLLAFASFGCARRKRTRSKQQHLSRANDYLAAQQYDKAEKEYRRVLKGQDLGPN